MEVELGVELLKRSNRSFTLTSAGEYFYKQSLIMVDEVDRIEQNLKKIATKKNDVLRIGYINNYCGLEIYNAIMKFSEIYPNIDIESQTVNHDFKDHCVLIPNPVTIKKNAWIGANVTICPRVEIGEGDVIGAGAVVTKDVEHYTVVAGVPAKFIKNIE